MKNLIFYIIYIPHCPACKLFLELFAFCKNVELVKINLLELQTEFKDELPYLLNDAISVPIILDEDKKKLDNNILLKYLNERQ